MNIRKIIAIAALAMSAVAAAAAEPRPYTRQEFDRLAQDGKPVLVDVAATWCPTCKAQKPLVEGLATGPAYKDVAVLTVDFDTDKAVLRQFKVGMQSTLIAFKGGKEVGRSVGDTTSAGIEGLFKKATQ
jgi:thioredoxin 1